MIDASAEMLFMRYQVRQILARVSVINQDKQDIFDPAISNANFYQHCYQTERLINELNAVIRTMSTLEELEVTDPIIEGRRH